MRQGVDAFREDETAAAQSEREGKKSVERDGAREAREISESGVGGEREHDEDGNDARPVEPARAGDGGEQLREDALVAGCAGGGGGDTVAGREIGDADQHDSEDADDDGQREAGVFGSRLLESHDAVADGFDSGHGRAAAGEGAQDAARRSRPAVAEVSFGGATTGTGWPPAAIAFDDADRDHAEQAGDEEIGGDAERFRRSRAPRAD